MFKLISSLFVGLSFSITCYALPDARISSMLHSFKVSLQRKTSITVKISRLENFEDQLLSEIESRPIPKTEAEKEKFAELNELLMAISTIEIKPAFADRDCKQSREMIRINGQISENALAESALHASENALAESALHAMDILKIICGSR